MYFVKMALLFSFRCPLPSHKYIVNSYPKLNEGKKNKETQIFSCDDSTIAARNIVGVVYKS